MRPVKLSDYGRSRALEDLKKISALVYQFDKDYGQDPLIYNIEGELEEIERKIRGLRWGS